MVTITFDTLKFVHRLRDGGFAEAQAEAIAEAFKDASGEAELVTKTDLQVELAPMRTDMVLLKWMVGFGLAFQVAIFVKLLMS